MSEGFVRKAAGSDRKACVEILKRAFDDDPVINWFVRQDSRREAGLEGFFQLAFDKLTFPFGDVCMTADGDGAALWNPPGTWKIGFIDQLGLLLDYLKIFKPSRLHLVVSRIQKIQNLHPSFRHYYLFAMGVIPASQGRGLGGALMRHVLVRCDELHLPAYLEATTARNMDFYLRHGFRVIGEFPLEENGPMIWFMLRNPNPHH